MEKYFVDESGDLAFFSKRGKPLKLDNNDGLRFFLLGYCKIRTQKNEMEILKNQLHTKLSTNLYKHVPRVKNSLDCFHSREDHPITRLEFLQFISMIDCSAKIIVYDKLFILEKIKQTYKSGNNKTVMDTKQIYHDLIARLFKTDLHISDNSVIFSERKDTLTNQSLKIALERAKRNYKITALKNNYQTPQEKKTQIFIGKPRDILELQIIDYILWSLSRFLNFEEDGYFLGIKDKISLINDIHDYKANTKYGAYHNKPFPKLTLEYIKERKGGRLEQNDF